MIRRPSVRARWPELAVAWPSWRSMAVARPAAKEPDARLEILDVGQGDSILIRSPEGKTALIDAGPSHGLAATLKRRGVTAIDLLVVSHHHADHYGGMAEVVKQFRPRVFLATNSPHTTSSYHLHEAAAGGRPSDSGILSYRRAGQRPRGRSAWVRSCTDRLPPAARGREGRERQARSGIRLDYGDFSTALLTGDEARSRAPAPLLGEGGAPRCSRDVTILPQAGPSRQPQRDRRQVARPGRAPEMAVAQPRRPATSTTATRTPRRSRSWSRPQGLPLLRTDLDGTIAIVCDGKTWDVSTFRETRPRACGRPRRVRRGRAAITVTPAPPSPTRGRRHAQARTRDARVKTASSPVDLNDASEDQLMDLPGIGPTLARRIALGRPYRSVDDLKHVLGSASRGWSAT